MIFIWSLACLSFLLAPSTASCDGGWVRRPGSNSCFNFVTSKSLTWNNAQALCMDMGGRLATLETEEEIIWQRGYRSYHPMLRKPRFWIGGYRKDGKWWWQGDLMDTPMIKTDWAKGQPDTGAGVQDCLILFGGDDDQDPSTEWFRFDNGHCSGVYPFICEKKHD